MEEVGHIRSRHPFHALTRLGAGVASTHTYYESSNIGDMRLSVPLLGAGSMPSSLQHSA